MHVLSLDLSCPCLHLLHASHVPQLPNLTLKDVLLYCFERWDIPHVPVVVAIVVVIGAVAGGSVGGCGGRALLPLLPH